MGYLFNKKVVAKYYEETLGEYNRPIRVLKERGTFPCKLVQNSSSTSQLQTQKQNATDMELYTERDAKIELGDILSIYSVDEYENIIPSTAIDGVADKPYILRTYSKISVLSQEEI